MSLDYPNRADWMKVRRAQHTMPLMRPISFGGTYVQGRNEEKRRARLDSKARTDMLSRRAVRQRYGH